MFINMLHSTGYLQNIRFSICFKACLIVYFIPSLQPFAQTTYKVRSTLSGCLQVRTDHSTEATSIDCITPGTQVTVLSSVPFWREIRYNNRTGWVAKKYLQLVETAEDSLTATLNAFLTIHYVDVGQGDAIWIQTYDDGIDGNGKYEGYSIVIDGGPKSSIRENALAAYMEREGHHGADIEALIISHPHVDHFNGSKTIAQHFTVNHFYDPAYPGGIQYNNFLKYIKGTSAATSRARNFHLGKPNFGIINWGSELKIDVLYAWSGDPDNVLGSGNTENNNASIVLRLQYGDHVFLFMGDAEGKDRADTPVEAKYVEKLLLETVPTKLKSTVLKIAHHGSETSSTIPFIQAVDPEIVIVQSGRKNFNGTFLPDLSTLKRYCNHNPNVKIYRTDYGDEEAGYTHNQAVDGDHIIIRSKGIGKPEVKAFDGGAVVTLTFCEN
ncbi:MAG: MBL fold metallo-hydrolase [Chitinophagaceae bacterium]|nr:MBL fold metallo-hydrolase [Chitinophagaceae bacterium]